MEALAAAASLPAAHNNNNDVYNHEFLIMIRTIK